MKVVFLDGGSLGDYMDLSPLRDKFDITVYPQTDSANVSERIQGAEVVITNKVPITRELLQENPQLKFINVAATGINNIDIEAATEREVKIANVKNYSTESVAQLVMSYMLAYANSLIEFQKDVKEGKWNTFPHFAMIAHQIFELSGKKLGIIGYGDIGKRVAEMAQAFNMEILVGARPGVDYSDTRHSITEIMETCDVVTVHTPLTEQTRDMIDENMLRRMKENALLINTARGGVVNEEALYNVLLSNKLQAAVDVLTEEPPRSGNILLEAPNIILTPHVAWASYESRIRLVEGLVNNIEMYKAGKADKVSVN